MYTGKGGEREGERRGRVEKRGKVYEGRKSGKVYKEGLWMGRSREKERVDGGKWWEEGWGEVIWRGRGLVRVF